MKKTILLLLALCLCFAAVGGAAAEKAAVEMTANLGDALAYINIGDLYLSGKGVEQDLKKDMEQAKEWIRKALDAGYAPDAEDEELVKAVLGDDYTP